MYKKWTSYFFEKSFLQDGINLQIGHKHCFRILLYDKDSKEFYMENYHKEKNLIY